MEQFRVTSEQIAEGESLQAVADQIKSLYPTHTITNCQEFTDRVLLTFQGPDGRFVQFDIQPANPKGAVAHDYIIPGHPNAPQSK